MLATDRDRHLVGVPGWAFANSSVGGAPVKSAMSRHIEGLTGVAKHAIAKLLAIVTLVRNVSSKQTARRPRLMGLNSPTHTRAEDAFWSENIDLLAVTSGALEDASADGSPLGYEDEAGVRHPLY